jgi:hypothetical protein
VLYIIENEEGEEEKEREREGIVCAYNCKIEKTPFLYTAYMRKVSCGSSSSSSSRGERTFMFLSYS